MLYPDDRTYEGKELRLKQQHFFVSSTVQDVVRRYKERHDNWDAFADKVSFQMNDTHPTLLVPELMRVLMDLEGLGWTKAWDLVTKVRIMALVCGGGGGGGDARSDVVVLVNLAVLARCNSNQHLQYVLHHRHSLSP